MIINSAKEQSPVQELFCTACRDYNNFCVHSWALSVELLPQSAQTRLKTQIMQLVVVVEMSCSFHRAVSMGDVGNAVISSSWPVRQGCCEFDTRTIDILFSMV